MSCKSLLYMVGMFVFVPVWIGLLWTDFLKIRERASQLLHAWVLGFATMLATAQLVLVPFVMMQKTLTQALLLWRIILQILAVLSFVIWLGHRRGRGCWDGGSGCNCADGGRRSREENWAWEKRNVDDCLWDSCGGSDSATGIYPRALRAQRR